MQQILIFERMVVVVGQRLVLLLLLMSAAVGAEPIKRDDVGSNVHERVIMGWLEPVVLESTTFALQAKLDTGTKTSSLHASKVETFNRGGQHWVRFMVDDFSRKPNHDRLQPTIAFEQPLLRTARVKRHGMESDQRPVVNLFFCLNGRHYEGEFTLIDRAGFNYPVLLGRAFLKHVALVDPAAINLTQSNLAGCSGGKTLSGSKDD